MLQNGPYSFFLNYFGKASYLTVFGQDVRPRKLPKFSLKKNSRTTHRIWHKSFSMTQSGEIKNWVPQLIFKLEKFNLLFLCVTGLSDLCDNLKYA